MDATTGTTAAAEEQPVTSAAQTTRSQAGLARMFVYGTLQSSRTLSHVVRRQINPATDMIPHVKLRGYARYAVVGQGYPGITAKESSEVEGTLVLNLKDEDLARLDEFEGDEYKRVVLTEVHRQLEVDGQPVADQADGGVCWMYLWQDDPERLQGEWIPGPDFSADAVYIPREGL